MKRLLLAEDQEPQVEAFRQKFEDIYDIKAVRSVNSAIDVLNTQGNEFDLFVLDANLPEEDPKEGDPLPDNSGAWIPIDDFIRSKLGNESIDKEIVYTNYKHDPDAIGRGVYAVPKEYGLDVLGIVMEKTAKKLRAFSPQVVLVTRYSDQADTINKCLTEMGACIKHYENIDNAISEIGGSHGLIQLLIVQLDLPPISASIPNALGHLRRASKLEDAFRLIDETRRYSPLTVIAAILPKELLDADLANRLTARGVIEVGLLEDDVKNFTAKCYGAVMATIAPFERLSAGLNINTDIGHGLTVVTGSWEGPIKRGIEKWKTFDEMNEILLLMSTDNEVLSWITLALSLELGEKSSLEIIDCESITFASFLGRVNNFVTHLARQDCVKLLILSNFDDSSFRLTRFESQRLRRVISRCPDVHLLITIHSNENVVREQLTPIFGKNWKFHKISSFGELETAEFRTAILSYLLAYGTYKGRCNITIDENVYGHLKNQSASLSTSAVLEILRISYDRSWNAGSDGAGHLNVAIVDEALFHRRSGHDQSGIAWLVTESINITTEDMKAIEELYSARKIKYSGIRSIERLRTEGKSGARIYGVRAQFQPPGASHPYDCPWSIVKIGEPHKIRKEVANYDTWVSIFQDRNVARIENYVSGGKGNKPGAIQYSYVRKGGSDRPLGDFATYATGESATYIKIISVIDSLFNGLLAPNWYSPSRENRDFPDFQRFYGAHLPPLFEIAVESKEDIRTGNEIPTTDQKSEKLWNILEKLKDQSEVQEELSDLEFPSPQYVASGKKDLTVQHTQGAVVKLVNERIDWNEVLQLVASDKPQGSSVRVKGNFKSKQHKLLLDLASTGLQAISPLIVHDLTKDRISFGLGHNYPNPLAIYQSFLKSGKNSRQIYGIIHGDLHWGNILVENGTAEPQAWLIDYGRTGLGPIVFDPIELEVNLLVNVLADHRFGKGVSFDYNDVLEILDMAKMELNEAYQKDIADKTDPMSQNKIVAAIIRSIRTHAEEFLPVDKLGRNWDSYYVGMCLYSLGFLRYLEFEDKDTEIDKKLKLIKRQICFTIAVKAASFEELEAVRHFQ